MLSNYFTGIFATADASSLTLVGFFVCMVTALVLGVFMAKLYTYKTKCTQSFAATLALIPVVVAMVIMMVNGNIGAGVAVAGAFSLVRFRSVPGTASEIGAIFTAMCTGLTIGMGYIGFAVLFALIASVFALVLSSMRFGSAGGEGRVLQITIPENLNYTNVFDDVFEEFATDTTLVSTRTTNMGSLFKLSYEVTLKAGQTEKAFIDALRCRNGNLEIKMSRPSDGHDVL